MANSRSPQFPRLTVASKNRAVEAGLFSIDDALVSKSQESHLSQCQCSPGQCQCSPGQCQCVAGDCTHDAGVTLALGAKYYDN
jgi:hypothetical protein